MSVPQKAVDQIVRDVLVACDGDLSKRRDVLQDHLAGLKVSDSDRIPWQDGLDIVGTAYERLFSGEERRDAGQFFTPFWAGDVMAGWLFDEKVDLCLDPEEGRGGLSIPAARHPKRRGARLVGLELDPLVEPNDGVDADALYKALNTPSVREQLDERRRVYGGGLWTLEPSELSSVRVRV